MAEFGNEFGVGLEPEEYQGEPDESDGLFESAGTGANADSQSTDAIEQRYIEALQRAALLYTERLCKREAVLQRRRLLKSADDPSGGYKTFCIVAALIEACIQGTKLTWESSIHELVKRCTAVAPKDRALARFRDDFAQYCFARADLLPPDVRSRSVHVPVLKSVSFQTLVPKVVLLDSFQFPVKLRFLPGIGQYEQVLRNWSPVELRGCAAVGKALLEQAHQASSDVLKLQILRRLQATIECTQELLEVVETDARASAEKLCLIWMQQAAREVSSFHRDVRQFITERHAELVRLSREAWASAWTILPADQSAILVHRIQMGVFSHREEFDNWLQYSAYFSEHFLNIVTNGQQAPKVKNDVVEEKIAELYRCTVMLADNYALRECIDQLYEQGSCPLKVLTFFRRFALARAVSQAAGRSDTGLRLSTTQYAVWECTIQAARPLLHDACVAREAEWVQLVHELKSAIMATTMSEFASHPMGDGVTPWTLRDEMLAEAQRRLRHVFVQQIQIPVLQRLNVKVTDDLFAETTVPFFHDQVDLVDVEQQSGEEAEEDQDEPMYSQYEADDDESQEEDHSPHTAIDEKDGIEVKYHNLERLMKQIETTVAEEVFLPNNRLRIPGSDAPGKLYHFMQDRVVQRGADRLREIWRGVDNIDEFVLPQEDAACLAMAREGLAHYRAMLQRGQILANTFPDVFDMDYGQQTIQYFRTASMRQKRFILRTCGNEGSFVEFVYAWQGALLSSVGVFNLFQHLGEFLAPAPEYDEAALEMNGQPPEQIDLI